MFFVGTWSLVCTMAPQWAIWYGDLGFMMEGMEAGPLWVWQIRRCLGLGGKLSWLVQAMCGVWCLQAQFHETLVVSEWRYQILSLH
jgi:hypothetical protein